MGGGNGTRTGPDVFLEKEKTPFRDFLKNRMTVQDKKHYLIYGKNAHPLAA